MIREKILHHDNQRSKNRKKENVGYVYVIETKAVLDRKA